MRILTLNTWGVNGPPERRAALQRAIGQTQADVASLQEATDPALLTSLGYPHRFHVPEAGLAILTRFPAEEERRLTYRTRSPLEPYARHALIVRFRMEEGPLWVVCTHLAWKAEDEQTRIGQAEELLQAVVPLGEDVLLSGDFNAVPDSRPIQWVREAGFVDLFQHLKPEEPGITWDNANPFIQSHAVKFPDRRIDYLWLKREALERFRPAACEVACDKPVPVGLPPGGRAPDIHPSDHYGVLAVLRR